MGLPDLYPAQVGSPYTTLAAPYTTGGATMTVVDATKLPDAPNIVCLAGDVAGEFSYTGKEGNVLQGVTALPGTPAAAWPAGTYAFRGVSAYDHDSVVEHLTYQRSHLTEAVSDLSSNLSYTGSILADAEAGEALVFGDLAVLAESGKFVKANPATLATLDGTIALVVSDTIAAGSQGMFLLRGLIRNDSWTFSPGKELYASNGTLTHEPPTTGTQIIRKVGTALTATIIEFNPSSTLHAEYLVSVLPVNTVSKDNGDIERKFFKDDFSVDSSSQYTFNASNYTFGDGVVVGDTTPAESEKYFVIEDPRVAGESFSVVWSSPSFFEQSGQQEPGIMFRFPHGIECLIYHPTETSPDITYRIGKTSSYTSPLGNIIGWGSVTLGDAAAVVAWFKSTHRIDVVKLNSTQFSVYMDGVLINTVSATFNELCGFSISPYKVNRSVNIYEIKSLPTESYSDNFSTDTTERYQAVTGTVAYDDANKRMNVTAGAGVTAKTRLKSYTQLEGAYKRKLHLPATGTDGDVVAAYFGTDPTLKSGFGIGAIRTAGVWNIATINGATVTDTGTVIADLVDGDSFYVEVERDTTHGVVWYYVYESGKPTSASGKLFNTYQEIYDGFWFRNKGAAENSVAVSEIEDRAESIVGRTNVEVTEPFWFRDEFGEDSRRRLRSVGTGISYDGENNECYVRGRYGIYITDHPTFIGETIVTIQTRNTGVSTDCHPCVVFGEPKKIYSMDYGNDFLNGNPTLCVRFSTNGVYVYQNGVVVPGAVSDAIKYQSGETQTFVVTYNGSNQITVSDGTNSITFTDDAFAVRTVFSAFVGTYSGSPPNGYENRFKLIEISGTRVYNKPIHRGAMLETYHDGTQEVVGTTLIHDFNWDRSAELSSTYRTTIDTVNGYRMMTETESGYPTYYFKGLKLGYGVYDIDFICGSGENIRLVFGAQTEYVNFLNNGVQATSYCIWFHKIQGKVLLMYRDYPNGETSLFSSAYTFTEGTKYYARLIWINGYISVYIGTSPTNMTHIFTTLQTQITTPGYFGAAFVNDKQAKICRISAIAASSDATNGIAACIPPIGGGARYGVEESVYIPITPGTEIPVGSAVISPNAKSTVVGTALTTFAQTPAGVSASLEYATGTKACPSLSTAFAPVGRHRVKADRNTLTNIGVKGSVAGTSPTVYIDSLHVRKQEAA